MSKSEIASRAGVGRSAAGDAVFEAIAGALAKGEDVRIGASLNIGVSTASTFKASKRLRDAVNAGRAP